MDQKLVIQDARDYRLYRKWIAEQGAPPAPNRRQRREYERVRARARRNGLSGLFALEIRTPVNGRVTHIHQRPLDAEGDRPC